MTQIDLELFFKAKIDCMKSILRTCALYLARQTLSDVFFVLIVVNSRKNHSSSFSNVLGVRIASAVLLQIRVDHGRQAPGEREIFSLCLWSAQTE